MFGETFSVGGNISNWVLLLGIENCHGFSPGYSCRNDVGVYSRTIGEYLVWQELFSIDKLVNKCVVLFYICKQVIP